VRAQQLAERIDQLQGRIDKLQGRENIAQADLIRKQARERAVAAQLAAARTRLARTTKRLKYSRRVLSGRLVAVYKSGQPDMVSVMLESDGFAEMLERAEYLHDVAKQDRRVIRDVAELKRKTHKQAVALSSLEVKAQAAIGIVAERKAGIVTAKNKAIAQAGNLQAEQRRVRRELAAIAARARAQQQPDTAPSTTSAPVVAKGGSVSLHSDGLASASSDAPQAIKNAVAAGNRIAKTPYLWGGGHGSFESSGYDCSGSVSYVLHAAGVLSAPMASGPLMSWGDGGPGKYITVYANAGHAFMNVGGVWFDTSGRGATGSRWQVGSKGTGGFAVRHPSGL
jgi:cell wall-associated NlpC family hydrolase